jgi:hypothetical protein
MHNQKNFKQINIWGNYTGIIKLILSQLLKQEISASSDNNRPFVL